MPLGPGMRRSWRPIWGVVSNMPSILLVEDSRAQAQTIKMVLEEAGYQVILAHSGQDGMEKLHRERPDVVISDIAMPEMNGYELCRRLKGDPALASIPVVLLTIKDDVLDIVRGLDAGADSFVPKPFEIDYLCEQLEAVLEGGLPPLEFYPEEVEVAPQAGSDQIVLTSPREQILEMLVKALRKRVECHAMAILTWGSGEDGFLALLVAEGLPLWARMELGRAAEEAAESFGQMVFPEGSLERQAIFISDLGGDSGEGFRSVVNVPLLEGGTTRGILTVASFNRQAYLPEDIKYLYEIGSKAAEVLNRLSRKGR